MILYIADRNIRVDDADNQISYNSDYIAEFRFDDEWNGKVKTARFVQNGEYVDIVLTNDRCEIPPLKTGFVRIGVFTDSMTSTYADVYYKTSIKDGTGNPAEPPEDVYAQLTALIESGMLKGEDGLTPYVGENNNWWIGDIDTGILARGTDGYTPVKGVDYFTEGEVQQIQNEVSESIQANINHLEINKADKSELDKTKLSLDALWKMNKGQTYDVLEQESEAYSVDVPSGAKYVGIDKVGGKSLVWNQLVDKSKNIKTQTISGVEFTNNDDGTITLNGTASEEILIIINQPRVLANHKHLLVGIEGGSNSTYYAQADYFSYIYSGRKIATPTSSGLISVRIGVRKDAVLSTVVFKPQLFDLTQMFGAGNEPNIEEFEAMFPADYYPYSKPTIISSQTDRLDVASADGTITQQIPTNFPVLNSAGSVYDYIDLNEGKLYTWTYIEGNEVKALTEPVITDIEIPTELSDWLTVEAGGSITFHNSDDGKRLLIPNKLSFIRKLDEVTV